MISIINTEHLFVGIDASLVCMGDNQAGFAHVFFD